MAKTMRVRSCDRYCGFCFQYVLIILSLPLSAALVNATGQNSKRGETPIAGGQLSQPTAKTRVVEKVKITMRDGVRLVADIVLPEAENKHPTILIRTPYGRRVEPDWVRRGQFFAARGYAVVVQALRGWLVGRCGGPWRIASEKGIVSG